MMHIIITVEMVEPSGYTRTSTFTETKFRLLSCFNCNYVAVYVEFSTLIGQNVLIKFLYSRKLQFSDSSSGYNLNRVTVLH